MDESSRRALRYERLGELIRQKRKQEKLTLEAVAKITGVSLSTLSRLERWKILADDDSERRMPEPDARTLSAVTTWLGISFDSVIRENPINPVPVTETTPDTVELYLRADRNLSPEAARALSNLFRVAYEQFAPPNMLEQDEVEENNM